MLQWVRTMIAVAALGAASTGWAQGYPTKAVRIFVPYSAGGPVDVIARAMAQKLGESWGQPVVVENRPGANEIIAAEATAKSPADGYTLLLATDPTLSQNPFLFDKLPYSATKDLVPVTRLIDVNMVLVVPASLPAATASEFVAYAKAKGAGMSYGSAGQGNTTHIAMEWFKNIGGFPMTHVPYKGIAPALQDMLAGNIQAVFCAVTAAEPHIKAGKVKALAVSGKARTKALPNVPTFAESGYAEFEATFYMGLVAPAGTPRAILDRIAGDARKVLYQPEFRGKYVDAFGFEPVGDTPEEFAAFIRRDQQVSERKIRISGVKLEM
jgi:tripartite-type tricarboxylate transporter receptor subunit TctC